MQSKLTDLNVSSITTLDSDAAPSAAAVASLIASIASSDGVLTPFEFLTSIEVTEEVAKLSDDPAIVRSLILRALSSAPKPLDSVLNEVAATRGDVLEQARQPLLVALFPLLSTQGANARPLARKIGSALGLKNVDLILEAGTLPLETGNIKAMFRRAGSSLIGDTAKLDLAAQIAHFTGDESLFKVVRSDRRERALHLDQALAHAFDQLHSTLAALDQAPGRYDNQSKIADSLDHDADVLERQFKARLRAVERRVMALRRNIREDVESLSEDSGDGAEVDFRRMSEGHGILLRNNDRDVRERMVTKSLAARHDRLKHRHDEQIQLLRDELAEYREDYVEAAREIVAPISLADWRLAVPGPTASARVKDALDRGSTRTLATGAVAAAGTVGAVSAGLIAPAAVASIVVAPVGIAVLGVVAVAGVWKLYANRGERLKGEQRDRAEAIRKAAHTKVEQAFSEVSTALDEVAEGFREVSLSRIAPLRHNAERIREMCALQKELVRRIRIDAQRRLERWQSSLPSG